MLPPGLEDVSLSRRSPLPLQFQSLFLAMWTVGAAFGEINLLPIEGFLRKPSRFICQEEYSPLLSPLNGHCLIVLFRPEE